LTEFASEGGNFEVLPTVVEAKGTMKEEDNEALRAMAKEMAEALRNS